MLVTKNFKTFQQKLCQMQSNSQGYREIEKVLGKATPGLSRSRVPARRSVLKLLEPDGEGENFLEGRITSHNP